VVEWRAKVPDLSTASDEFAVTLGAASDPTAGESSLGYYFRYERELGGNWVACVASGTDRTRVDSGVPVVADGFVRARVMNDGAGIAYFYLDGSLVATISANHPPERSTYGPVAGITKTSGSADRSVVVDYFAARFETAR
jgi:hypothetical protein